MQMLMTFVRYEVDFMLVSLALIVVYQLLTGQINTARLLEDKGKTPQLSPERVQLLMVTLVGALFYLTQAVSHPSQFPTLPRELLALLGGSNLLYLGGKAFPLIRSQREAETHPETKDEGVKK